MVPLTMSKMAPSPGISRKNPATEAVTLVKIPAICAGNLAKIPTTASSARRNPPGSQSQNPANHPFTVSQWAMIPSGVNCAATSPRANPACTGRASQKSPNHVLTPFNFSPIQLRAAPPAALSLSQWITASTMAAPKAMTPTTIQVMGLAHRAALNSHMAPVASNMTPFHSNMTPFHSSMAPANANTAPWVSNIAPRMSHMAALAASRTILNGTMARVSSPKAIFATPTATAMTSTAPAPKKRRRVRWGKRAVHTSNFRTVPVMLSTRVVSMGRKRLPMVMLRLSQADLSPSSFPRRFSSISRATRLAVPRAFSSFSMKGCSPPDPACLTSCTAAAAASSPKIRLKAPSRAAFPSPVVAAASFSRMGVMPKNRPAESLVATPKDFRRAAASPVGAESRSKIARKAVPAWEALMPTLPSSPAAAAMVSRLSPTLEAIGPTNFMVPPSISRLVLEEIKVLVSTSPTRPICAARSPNPERMSLAISAARPSSRLPALAMSSTPGMAAMIWFVLKPACPKNCIPCAAWEAEKLVVAPSRRAVLVKPLISAAVACVTARTEAICDSKAAAAEMGEANTAASASAPAVAAMNPDCIKPVARLTSAAMDRAWPVTVRTTRPMGPVIRSLRRRMNCRADGWPAAMFGVPGFWFLVPGPYLIRMARTMAFCTALWRRSVSRLSSSMAPA